MKQDKQEAFCTSQKLDDNNFNSGNGKLLNFIKSNKMYLIIGGISLVVIIIIIAVAVGCSKKKSKSEEKNDFTEIVETIDNPGMGYTSITGFNAKPGETPSYDLHGNINILFIDIGGFSAGINGLGVDYDFDDTFFNSLRITFSNIRKNGGFIAIRFRYDSNGNSNPEPNTFEQVQKHITQLKESNLFEEYKDIICYIESGFLGAYGEQHSGKYTDQVYLPKLLGDLLTAIPSPIPITVRVPRTFANWAGINITELDKFVSTKGTDSARVGIYNDGYMGSKSDLGTFNNRTIETNWMFNQMKYTYYGGEFSGAIDFAIEEGQYVPELAIPEMYKTHLSYINGNIYQMYKNFTFKKDYDIEGVDNSAYYGKNVYQFIRDHLGYRFVLRYIEITSTVKQGGNINIKAKIENTGFANPILEPITEFILEKDGNFLMTETDVKANEWLSANTTSIDVKLKIPGGLEPGEWTVYIKLSFSTHDNIFSYWQRSIKFANKNRWASLMGANKLGKVKIEKSSKKSLLTDRYFYQLNTNTTIQKSEGILYTFNNITIINDKLTGNNWEPFVVFQEGDKKVAIKNNNEYLFIMAKLPYKITTPVINLSFNNGVKTIVWYKNVDQIYYSESNTTGWKFKFEDYIHEFQIPLGSVANIYVNSVIKDITVFIQDYSCGWPTVATVKVDNYTLTDTCDVYTPLRTVYLTKGSNFSINYLQLSCVPASYQWYFNNNIITGATSKDYEIINANSNNVGIYSVKIYTSTGGDALFNVCKINGVL